MLQIAQRRPDKIRIGMIRATKDYETPLRYRPAPCEPETYVGNILHPRNRNRQEANRVHLSRDATPAAPARLRFAPWLWCLAFSKEGCVAGVETRFHLPEASGGPPRSPSDLPLRSLASRRPATQPALFSLRVGYGGQPASEKDC